MPEYEVTLRADVIYTVVLEAEDEDQAGKDALFNIDDDYEVDFEVDSIQELSGERE